MRHGLGGYGRDGRRWRSGRGRRFGHRRRGRVAGRGQGSYQDGGNRSSHAVNLTAWGKREP